MFPDLFDEDDLASLPSWGLPGYDRSMPATKGGSKAKGAAGKTAKRKTTPTKKSK
jgi:hypothetical protein